MDKRSRSRRPRVVVVASCSSTKRLPVAPALRLGAIGGASTATRVRLWRRTLEGASAERVAVDEIYGGGHWHAVVASIRTVRAAGFDAELWVASAGYGLVRSDALLKPYSATFAAGHADSVWRGSIDGDRRSCLAEWWHEVQPEASLRDLLSTTANDALLVVAGAAYVDAMRGQIEALDRETVDQRVSVLSVGGPPVAAKLPAAVGLRTKLGGTRGTLNARALRLLAERATEHRFRRDAMSRVLLDVQGYELRDEFPIRRALADAEVARFIRQYIRRDTSLSRTRALRLLRDNGFACEQTRFARIWESCATSGNAAAA